MPSYNRRSADATSLHRWYVIHLDAGMLSGSPPCRQCWPQLAQGRNKAGGRGGSGQGNSISGRAVGRLAGMPGRGQAQDSAIKQNPRPVHKASWPPWVCTWYLAAADPRSTWGRLVLSLVQGQFSCILITFSCEICSYTGEALASHILCWIWCRPLCLTIPAPCRIAL